MYVFGYTVADSKPYAVEPVSGSGRKSETWRHPCEFGPVLRRTLSPQTTHLGTFSSHTQWIDKLRPFSAKV